MDFVYKDGKMSQTSQIRTELYLIYTDLNLNLKLESIKLAAQKTLKTTSF